MNGEQLAQDVTQSCELCDGGVNIEVVDVVFEREDGSYGDPETATRMRLCEDCREECQA